MTLSDKQYEDLNKTRDVRLLSASLKPEHHNNVSYIIKNLGSATIPLFIVSEIVILWLIILLMPTVVVGSTADKIVSSILSASIVPALGVCGAVALSFVKKREWARSKRVLNTHPQLMKYAVADHKNQNRNATEEEHATLNQKYVNERAEIFERNNPNLPNNSLIITEKLSISNETTTNPQDIIYTQQNSK